MSKPEISVVIGSFNRRCFLKLALQSVRDELCRLNLFSEIIVVDGGSTDGTVLWLANQKDVITIVQHNHGVWQGKSIRRRSWGYFMNLGFKCAQGKYVCMLSDDCLVVPGAICKGYKRFEELQNSGGNVGAVAFYWRNWPEKGPYVVGTTLSGKIFVNHGLYLKSALEDVGYVDEETYCFYHADGDLCLKMWQKGYACIDSAESFIEHYSHANATQRSKNLEKAAEDWRNYLSKWKGIYYLEESETTGGRLEKNYDDSSAIADLFTSAESLREKLVRWQNALRKTFHSD